MIWSEKQHRHRLLLADPVNSANTKLLFLFYKNITAEPLDLIASGLRHPDYLAALKNNSIDLDVKLFWTADRFPYYEDTAAVDYIPPAGPGNVSAPSPGPSGQAPQSRRFGLLATGSIFVVRPWQNSGAS